MIEFTTTETAAVVVASAVAVAAVWRNGVSAVMAPTAFSGKALRAIAPTTHKVPASGLFRADADVYGTPQSRGSCW
jgi:hypothetical protein